MTDSADAGRQPARVEAIDVPGARVTEVFEPDSVDGLRALVEAAVADGRSLLIAGGRTRLHWANPARPLSFALSTRGLAGIDVFEPDEGVIHAAAGTRLAELRAAALAEGWELPLDAPGARSTVGGVLSAAVQGPRAQAFGPVRDAILGLELVGGDGIASKCGGRVVKNVTGYDLAKLYCGAFGSLGVITGAWLRLRPRPAVQRAFRADLDAATPSAAMPDLEACRSLAELGSVRAFVWSSGRTARGSAAGPSIHLELGGNEAEVAHDLSHLEACFALTEVSCESMDALRDARAEARDDALVLRARVPGTRCVQLARELQAMGLEIEVEPGLGVIHARGTLDATVASIASASAATLGALRSRAEALGGIATFERLPDAWREELDVFGDPGDAGNLMKQLKRRFDPQGILNPGRFVSGI